MKNYMVMNKKKNYIAPDVEMVEVKTGSIIMASQESMTTISSTAGTKWSGSDDYDD